MSEPDDARDQRSPGPSRRLGVRLGVGLTAGLIAIGTVSAAAVLPLQDRAVDAPSLRVEPAAGEQSISCPGPLVRLSDDSGAGATRISTVGGVVTAEGTNPLRVPTSRNDLQQPDNTGAQKQTPPHRVDAASVVDGARVALAAAQAAQPAQAELAGLAVTGCQPASLDSWLVGGATRTGRTSFVFLANPSDVSATVDLTVYTEQGVLSAPGSRGIVVPAGAQRVLSLAGLAPNSTSPIVRVQSTGGAVSAWLQQSIVRGLAPGGVELTGSVGAPSTQLVIPGVEVSGTTAIAERLVQSANNEDLQAVLRVFPQGSAATAMVVTFKSEAIGVPDITRNLGATAGLVSDFVLQDIPDGTYAVTITADHPVLAAVRTSVVSGNDVDFAWFQSAQTHREPFVITAPNGPSPRLHVFNPGSAESVLEIATPQGEKASFAIPAGTAAGIPLGTSVYTANVRGQLVASIGYLGAGRFSALVLSPPGALDGELRVFPN